MSSVIEKQNGYIYVNSFLKQSGSDYNFVVNVPQVQCSQISLVGIYMDVLMPNFYKTTGYDFSQFGMNVAGLSLRLQCDVYISSLTEFVQWFNSYSARYKIQQQVVPSWQKIFQFRVQDSQSNNAYVQSELVGDGWSKLGINNYTLKQTHTGDKIFDFSLSPSIQLRIMNPILQNNIKSNVGQSHFTVPLQASFGSKLIYDIQATEQQRNTIYLDQQISFNTVEIQLLNCDYAPLYTADFGSGRDQNNAEVVIVFAMKKNV